MNKPRKLIFALCFSLFFVSCTSVAHYEKIDSSVSRGDFKGALAEVVASKSSAYPKNDQVLYFLDAGMLAHYAGDYGESSKLLGSAEKGIEAAFTKSISLEVASYLVNDNTKEYAGEDYEDLYLNVFNALDYYNAGSIDDALVEIRRVDNKIKFLSTKYGTAITNAQKAVMEKNSGIPYDPSTATVHFTSSALASYLGMLFYRAEGKSDDARIDRDQVKLAFANQPSMYSFGLPSTLDQELDVAPGKARLNVISFNGLSPIKTENTVRIPIGEGHWIKISLPVIVTRPSAIARTEVVFDTGKILVLEPVENMGKVAVETFKQKAGLIYLKTVLRSMAKTSSSVMLDEKSRKLGNSNEGLLLGLLSAGVQVYAEASEQADLRLSRYFPSTALVGGITLDPGVYSFTVRYYNSAKELINEVPFKDVTVRADQLNLSEAICIK
jgi:hypothetical protein